MAKEIVQLQNMLGTSFDLQCLPAGFHNTPLEIVPGLKKILDERGADYDQILIGYGDCGTGGGLDRLLEDYPNTQRLPGAHCYAFYAGLPNFDAMMDEELGTFFLTDYLVRHFDTLIVKGMGLDRFPHLRDSYFKHYTRLTYLAQTADASLMDKAQEAAKFLGLVFVPKFVGMGELSTFIADMKPQPSQHA
ncbi:MAG: DUF1638 domain-containing protein [Maricaulaceae bacterium]